MLDRRVWRAALATLAMLTAAACSAQPSGTLTTSRPHSPIARVAPGGAARPSLKRHGRRPTKVLLVVEENHTEAAALAGMPYLRKLAGRFGRTTAYRAVSHPSLPNYLALVGGSTFGVRDDNNPSVHRLPGRSVLDQAIAAGKAARTYAESMPGNCALTPSGRYAVKHNPWAYFSAPRSRANCRHNDVSLGTMSRGPLHGAVVRGRLPTVGLVVPNLCNDAHDCPLATADRWLHRWIALVRTGADWRSGRLAIVVTFDENDGSTPNKVLTVVLSKSTRHVTATQHFTHYSWTRYAGQLIGAHGLRHARHQPSIRSAFHL
jgi:acid phosphatase